MTDAQTRAAERDALSGSLEERTHALVRRMRAHEPTLVYPGGAMMCRKPGYPATRSMGLPPGAMVHVWCDCGGGFKPREIIHPPNLAPMTQQRVTLAAFLGDEVARKVIGGEAHCGAIHAIGERCGDLDSFPPWIKRLRELAIAWGFEHQVLARASIAAAWVTLERWSAPHFDCPEDCTCVLAARTLRAADAWADCPCGPHRAAWTIANVATGLPTVAWLPGCPEHAQGCLVGAAAVLDTLGDDGVHLVRTAVATRLIPWILGHDPKV